MNKALIARSCLENYSAAAAAAAAAAAQLQPALHIHFVSPLHRDERAAPRPAKATPNLVPGSALLRAIVCPGPPASCRPDCREHGGPESSSYPLLLAPLLPVLSLLPVSPSLTPFLSSRLYFSPVSLFLVSLPVLRVSDTLPWTFSKSLSPCVHLSGLECKTHETLFGPFSPSLLQLQKCPGFLGPWGQ